MVYGGNKVENGTKVTITSGQMLYAQWTRALYTIRYDANGGVITARFENVPTGSCVWLAAYQNERLTELQEKTYMGRELTFNLPTGAYELCKLMVWSGEDRLTPLCAAQRLIP